MTDEEVICGFMEPKPDQIPEDAEDLELCGSRPTTALGFWVCISPYDVASRWIPRRLTLDALWEVEERLSGAQRFNYLKALKLVDRPGEIPRTLPEGFFWHAHRAQKIKALSTVLRAEQEKTA